MDKEKFQLVGNVINRYGLKGDLKVVLKPHLKLNPNKKIKLLFYAPTKINFLPLKVAEFKKKHNYYLLRLADQMEESRLEALKNIDLYSLVTNQEFVDTNWWKDYQVVIDRQLYPVRDLWNNGHYDLLQISYHQRSQWVPLTGEYINFINHDRKMIYLNKVGVLNEV